MAQKKYVTLSKLGTFLASLRSTFAPLSHSHKVADMSDYQVDQILSSTSNNPIANKTVNDNFANCFNAISDNEKKTNEKANKYTLKTSSLAVSDWEGSSAPYTIRVNVQEVLKKSDVQIAPNPDMSSSQLEAWEDLRLYAGETYDGYIILKASGIRPTCDLPINILIGSEIL